jgi:hypothetical protein
MAPLDPTPHGGEVMHSPAAPRFPEPGPGGESDAPPSGPPGARGDVQPGPAERPRETGPDVISPRKDPLLGTGDDVAG